MTDNERIAAIEQWLREFSYMRLADPKTDYFRGIASVFDDMEARLEIWKRNDERAQKEGTNVCPQNLHIDQRIEAIVENGVVTGIKLV